MNGNKSTENRTSAAALIGLDDPDTVLAGMSEQELRKAIRELGRRTGEEGKLPEEELESVVGGSASHALRELLKKLKRSESGKGGSGGFHGGGGGHAF